MPTCPICADYGMVRSATEGWEYDIRNRRSVLANRTRGKETPSDGTTHTQRIGPLPWTPVGSTRREGIDGITCQVFLGSVRRDQSGRGSMPVPRQDAINLAATSQGDLPSELNIYRYAKLNVQ